jgi:hypothetical protein
VRTSGRLQRAFVRQSVPRGWSWLFPPYRWHLDAIARAPVAAIAIDGACLRGKCHADHELMGRFAELMLQRHQATRRQLLEVYARGRA